MTTSRRRVLAALAAAGGAGALTGSGSGALLGDASRFDERLTSGVLDVVADYWLLSGPGSGAGGGFDVSDPDGVVDGPTIDVPVDTLSGDEPAGSMLLRFALPQPADAVNNPGNLWLRTACPPASALAEALQVRLSYADADGTRGSTIADGSLREVADALRTGVHLDPDGDPATDTPGCLTDELFVRLEYDLGDYVGTGTTALPLSFVAVQCRNTDSAVSPFATADRDDECESPSGCECCQAIGTVELEGTFRPGTTYAFDEGTSDYAIDVTAVDGESGVAFDLVSTDGGSAPSLCAVHVKGGPDDERYGRRDGEFGSGTSVLEGTTDGLVSAPVNPNNGKRYGVSYVLVKVCTPALGDGDCPADLTRPAASVGRSSGAGEDGRRQR